VRPVRSCVGCGARAPQDTLIRMTWRAGTLRADTVERIGGRGGYLHRRPACWDAFVVRRGGVRSLRAAIPRPAREALVRELGADGRREQS
jgi:predicted RNA-binding protein YlxR (DUF448 family)